MLIASSTYSMRVITFPGGHICSQPSPNRALICHVYRVEMRDICIALSTWQLCGLPREAVR